MVNRDHLKQLKEGHKLTRQQLADLAMVPLPTMNNWLLPTTSKASRPCPDNIVELIRLRINAKSSG